MATVVYRSCLESQLSEPKALRLKLSSPAPTFPSQPLELALKSCFLDDESSCNPNNRTHPGFSFLQALSCAYPSPERERVYVHPQAKPSLSEKSLALCTENLGNETGSDVADDDIFTVVDRRNCGTIMENHGISSPQTLKSRRGNANNPSFPPPLTSTMQLSPHREDGRLVLKATKSPSRTSCFQAERSNGRLRLCLLKDEPFQPNENDMESGGLELDHLNRRGSGRCVAGDQETRALGFLNWDPCWVASS